MFAITVHEFHLLLEVFFLGQEQIDAVGAHIIR